MAIFDDDPKLRREFLKLEREQNRESRKSDSGMWLCFLGANNAWTFVFGGKRRGTPTTLKDFPLFFQTRAEAVKAAKACDLKVDRAGYTTVDRAKLDRE